MQYLKELPKKWAIQRTPDNYKIVNDYFNKNYYKDGELGCTTGYVHSENIHTTKPYKSNCEGSLVTGYTEISTIEFKVLVLGEKMLVSSLKENECIHVSTEEEDRQIRNLLHDLGKTWCNKKAYNDENANNAWKNYNTKGVINVWDNTFADTEYANEYNYTIYPASYFINTNNTNMNTDKEIIGYVLKPEYKNSNIMKAAGEIAFGRPSGNSSIQVYDGENTKYSFLSTIEDPNIMQINLEKAGVLNLWFNPVHKEEKRYSIGDWVTVVTANRMGNYKENYIFKIDKLFKTDDSYCREANTSIGISIKNIRFATKEEIAKASEQVVEMAEGFTLVIRDKKVFHKEEDITSYVLALRKIFCNYMDTTIGDRNWDLQIDDIIIKKSGCKSKATRYSQWMAIYEKIK